MDIEARPLAETRPIVTARPLVEESEKSGAGVQPVPFLPTVIVSDDEPSTLSSARIRTNEPTARNIRRRRPAAAKPLRRWLPLLFLALSLAAFCGALALLATRS